MIYKLRSSYSIVLKVILDLQIDSEELDISDVVEWVGEAVEKIGGQHIYNTNVSGESEEDVIKVRSYQAELPCHLYQLLSVAWSKDLNVWRPVRSSSSSFNEWGNKGERRLSFDKRGITDANGILLPYQLLELDADLIIKRPLHGTDFSYDLQYSIKPGYININVPDGYLKLLYTTILVDENGYPLVPDNANVSEAIYYYIAMKLLFRKYFKGEMTQYLYKDIEDNWRRFRTLAYGEIMMPNRDGLQSFQGVWNKLYPEMRTFDTFDSTVGETQVFRDQDKLIWGRRNYLRYY